MNEVRNPAEILHADIVKITFQFPLHLINKM